jgi:hypothetical protein
LSLSASNLVKISTTGTLEIENVRNVQEKKQKMYLCQFPN